MSSPVHQPGRSLRWTTANIDEGLPGVVTPLTWSFYFPAEEEATRAAWFGLGAMTRAERPVPAEVDGRFFTVVCGRGAANVDLFGRMADRMPGASAQAFEMQLFGSSADAPSAHTSRRYPIVAAKAAPTVRRAMRAFAPLAASTDAWWRRAVRGEVGLAEARARFAPVLNVHLVLTMVCQGLLERVAAVAAGAGLPGLERELIKSAGGTAEFELVADLRRLADEQIDMRTFLDRHGYHGAREGLLDAVSWREDPAPIEALAERYSKRGWPESPAELVARRTAEQADALRRLEQALGPVRAAPARALIRFAAHAPEWRETGRSTILKVVDAGRAAAKNAPGVVFAFTVDEILRGALDPGVAAERQAEYEHHATLQLPHVWRGVPEPVVVAEPEPATVLEGLGVSSGVAEGIARIVHDQDTAELEDGDILVCRVTDPSWASLFPLAEGVVTDVGSAMSHAAIVCRELGIPCVAGTRDGTRRLTDGARIRVDGTNGKVEVLR